MSLICINAAIYQYFSHWLNSVVKISHFSMHFKQFISFSISFCDSLQFWWAILGFVEVIGHNHWKHCQWSLGSNLLKNIEWNSVVKRNHFQCFSHNFISISILFGIPLTILVSSCMFCWGDWSQVLKKQSMIFKFRPIRNLYWIQLWKATISQCFSHNFILF